MDSQLDSVYASTEEESLFPHLQIQKKEHLKSINRIYSGNDGKLIFPVHMDQTVPECSSYNSDCNTKDQCCMIDEEVFYDALEYAHQNEPTTSEDGKKMLHPVHMDQAVPERKYSESDVLETKPILNLQDSDCKTRARSDKDEKLNPMVSEWSRSNAPQTKAIVDESDPMSEPRRRAVYAQRPQLVKVIWENIKYKLHGHAGGFLNDYEEQKIDACDTNTEKMDLVLYYLRTKSNKAFTSFFKALMSSGYDTFALKLSEEADVHIQFEETMAERLMNKRKVLDKREHAYDWEHVVNPLKKPLDSVRKHFRKFVYKASDDTFDTVWDEYQTSFAKKQKCLDFPDIPRQRREFVDHVGKNTSFPDISLVREIAFREHCNSSALTEAVLHYEAVLNPLMTTAIDELTERCEVIPIAKNSCEGTHKFILKFHHDANVQALWEAETYLKTCHKIEEAKLLAFGFGCIVAYFDISCSPDQLETLQEWFIAHSEKWEALGVSGADLVNHWTWEAKETPPSCTLVRKRSPSQTGGPVSKFSESQSADTHSMQLRDTEDVDYSQNDYSKQVSSEDEEELLNPVSMDQMMPECTCSELDAVEVKLLPDLPDYKNFPMSEPIRRAVCAQRPQLCKVLWGNIKANLHVDAGGFLNNYEEEMIDACPTNREKMYLVLENLRIKDNKEAFTSFCGALVSSGYHHFALKLSEEAGVNIEENLIMAQRQMSTENVLSKKKCAYDWESVLTPLKKPLDSVWSHFGKFVEEASDDVFFAVRDIYQLSLSIQQKLLHLLHVPKQRREFVDHARKHTSFADIRLVREIAFSKHCNSSTLTEAVEDYENLLKPLMTTAIPELTDRCEVKPIGEISPEGTYKLVLKFPDDANVKMLYEAKDYLETCLGIEEAKLLYFDFGCILAYFEVSCSPNQLEVLREWFIAHLQQWRALGVSAAYLVNHLVWEAKESGQLSFDSTHKRSPSQTRGSVCKISESQSTDTPGVQLGHIEDGDQSQTDNSLAILLEPLQKQSWSTVWSSISYLVSHLTGPCMKSF